jgi:hypothetical protein
MSDFVTAQLAKIAAAREAKLAAQAAAPPAPPVEAAPPALAAPTAQAAEPPAPQKPTDCAQADWDAMPQDVKVLVALGPAGQCVPVNPPEATQGLVESATGRPAEAAPKRRGPGRPKKDDGTTVVATVVAAPEAQSSDAAPVGPMMSIEPLCEELEHQGVGIRAELQAIRAAIEANTAATNALVEAVLGAASILAG